MVLAEIAQGLGSRLECTVLTRGYADCPVEERLAGMNVVRYPNPAPERWKDYATGKHRVSFPSKLCVGVFDVLGSAPLIRKLAQRVEDRSEERRVGKECSSPCRSRWSPYH